MNFTRKSRNLFYLFFRIKNTNKNKQEKKLEEFKLNNSSRKKINKKNKENKEIKLIKKKSFIKPNN